MWTSGGVGDSPISDVVSAVGVLSGDSSVSAVGVLSGTRDPSDSAVGVLSGTDDPPDPAVGVLSGEGEPSDSAVGVLSGTDAPTAAGAVADGSEVSRAVLTDECALFSGSHSQPPQLTNWS